MCRRLDVEYTTYKNKGREKTEKNEEQSENGTVSGAMPDLWPVGNQEKLKQAKRESNWHAPWQLIGKCHGGAT